MKRLFFFSIVLLFFNKIWCIENAQILDFIVPTGLKERETTFKVMDFLYKHGFADGDFLVPQTLNFFPEYVCDITTESFIKS